jgi:peptidoglycan/LPS O-acetylase OafA/YrhL
MKYRSEIDGLRAIAVVPVILFHAGFEIFSGGFVGVDVFFVISGYLITTIIINEMDEGKFSLLNFYERRARRILPALFFVVLCCLPFAWFLLMPSDMKDFSQSLVAVATFSSNILFWRESGYFSTAAELKPLLHTWSLAVEEQFYILFPLFLMAAWRFGKRIIVWTLVAAFVISLATAQWGAYNKPGATFYLLPTRAWELLIGSFAAFYLQKRSVTTSLWASNALSAVGLLAILYGVFAFDKATPFPSVYALAPTAGTVLIILFAVRGTAMNSLLSMRGFVGVGLISYSLYLWHQPVFTFWRHYQIFEPTHVQMALLSLVCLPLAYFTYRFVEAPFRKIKLYINAKQITLWSALLMFGIINFGVLGHLTYGFSSFSERRQEFLNINARIAVNHGLSSDCEGGFNQSPNCYTSEAPNVLLWGDSFAMHLAQGILASEPNVAIQQHTTSGCSPILNAAAFNQWQTDAAERCIEFNSNVFSWLEENPSVEMVILSSPFRIVNGNFLSFGSVYSAERGEGNLLGLMRQTIDRISELGVSVLVVSPTPTSGRNNGRCVAKAIYWALPQNTCDFEYLESAGEEFVRAISDFAPVYWLADDICSNSVCEAYTGEAFIFRDGGHLSHEGSALLGVNNNWLPRWRELTLAYNRD